MNRPTHLVSRSIFDASLIIAGSELCLDGDRTDLNGVLDALGRAGIDLSPPELNVVIERARMERAARKSMEMRHAAH